MDYRMEAAHVRRATSYYDEDGVSAAQTVKGFADHLLSKSSNTWRKIKVLCTGFGLCIILFVVNVIFKICEVKFAWGVGCTEVKLTFSIRGAYWNLQLSFVVL